MSPRFGWVLTGLCVALVAIGCEVETESEGEEDIEEELLEEAGLCVEADLLVCACPNGSTVVLCKSCEGAASACRAGQDDVPGTDASGITLTGAD